MEEVGAFEAKTHLPRLLNRVAEGERITITRHGKPVALLIPVDEAGSLTAKESARRIRELRQGITWGEGMTLKEAIEAGRE